MLNLPAPSPDYSGLVRFLVEPLLNPSESISVDCEEINSTQRVWLRLAFDTQEKGHIYGRGGRNLTAIRRVLTAAASVNRQSLYLDVYGGENYHHDSLSKEGDSTKKIGQRRGNNSKPKIQ